jgi:copper resistance protein B
VIGGLLVVIAAVGTAESNSPEPPPTQENGHVHHTHDPSSQREVTQSEAEHVAPDPPQTSLENTSDERMVDLMQMQDDARTGKFLLDRAEWREVDDASAGFWDLHAWYGGDYNKLWIKSEGVVREGNTEARGELLWDRIVSPWWHVQAGVRHDIGEGPSRSWAAFGTQGLAPYFFEIEATLYLGEEGRTAARFAAEYELLLTQRLILQPKLELNLYGKSDPDNDIGAGLADAEFGVRVRYEIRREFAPYIGIAWTSSYGNTADLLRASGRDTSELQALAGVRIWF